MSKTKTLEVKVLQRHINKADQGATNTCAVALAVAEQFGLDMDDVRENKGFNDYDSGDCVSVTDSEIQVRKTNGFNFSFTWTKIPAKVSNFINRFDDDKKSVKPFSFKLQFFAR